MQALTTEMSSSPLPLWTEYLQGVYTNPKDSYEALKRLYELKRQAVMDDISFLKRDIAELKKNSPKQEAFSISCIRWFFYRALCLAGAIYSLCAGFDGMISVLSMLFPHLYLGLIITFGVVSAVSGLGIFIARDKPSIALELGIEEPSDFSGIEAYLFLLQQYLHLKKTAVTTQALEAEETGKKLPDGVFNELFAKKEQFKGLKNLFKAVIDLNDQRIESWEVFIKSNLVLMIAAVLFFGDGFFVGEAIGSFLAASMHLNPVFFTYAMALLLACCALAAYCFVERPSLKEYLHGSFFTNQTIFVEKHQEIEDDLSQICLARH